MNKKTLGLAILVFFVGLTLGSLWAPFSKPSSVAEHWKIVRAYRAFLSDRSNYKHDPQTGLMVTTPPPDPLPSLAALKAAEEIEHINIVLPNVPNNRAINVHWMQFCEGRDDILQATGNPSYTDYRPSGKEPLHLDLWFKTSAKPEVQQLIKELEKLAAEVKPM